jgi:hypothetical protein
VGRQLARRLEHGLHHSGGATQSCSAALDGVQMPRTTCVRSPPGGLRLTSGLRLTVQHGLGQNGLLRGVHLDRVWPDADPVGNRLAAARDGHWQERIYDWSA